MPDRAMCSCGRAEVELGTDLCGYCRQDYERQEDERADEERMMYAEQEAAYHAEQEAEHALWLNAQAPDG